MRGLRRVAVGSACFVGLLLLAVGVGRANQLDDAWRKLEQQDRRVIACSGGTILRTPSGLRLRTRLGPLELRNFHYPACEDDVNLCRSYFAQRHFPRLPAYVIIETLYEGYNTLWISGTTGNRTTIADHYALSPKRQYVLGISAEGMMSEAKVAIWKLDDHADLVVAFEAPTPCADNLLFAAAWRDEEHVVLSARKRATTRVFGTRLLVERGAEGWRVANLEAFKKDPDYRRNCER